MKGPSASPQLSPQTAELLHRYCDEIEKLYTQAAALALQGPPGSADWLGENPSQTLQELAHRLCTRVVVQLVRADRALSAAERELCLLLCERLHGKPIPAKEASSAIKILFELHDDMSWSELLSPFERLPLLQELITKLESLITRLANLVAKCDGKFDTEEERHLNHILSEFNRNLRPLPLLVESTDRLPTVRAAGQGATAERKLSERGAAQKPIPGGRAPAAPRGTRQQGAPTQRNPGTAATSKEPVPQHDLATCLAELDQMIGLAAVKTEVRLLTNFLRVQQARQERGKPMVNVSLHMVFSGNPGTGKTTVARIVGKIFGALGILARGHLIETDRAGLVAEYAGQTGPKTHAKVDAALDGVLFVDEAYSLVPEEGEDPYGAEAVQALLKRIEDDRHRLVVILAGYPADMQRLLSSNAGLSSRFPKTLVFDDYAPHELCLIFSEFCLDYHYKLTPAARLKLFWGFHRQRAEANEHYGNARAARNLFESAIRQHADRIANLSPVTDCLLETLEAEDLQLDLPLSATEQKAECAQWAEQVRLELKCPGCANTLTPRAVELGKEHPCPQCKSPISVGWGPLVKS